LGSHIKSAGCSVAIRLAGEGFVEHKKNPADCSVGVLRLKLVDDWAGHPGLVEWVIPTVLLQRKNPRRITCRGFGIKA